MKKLIIFVVIVTILVLAGLFIVWNNKETEGLKPGITIDDFEECVAAGYPTLESYPRQCKTANGKTYIEDIGNELEKLNLIIIDSPRPNSKIKSPLQISGQARGYWFFEADFPVRLLDDNGNELGTSLARALSDWTTSDFVPFEATLEYEASATNRGVLILERDNPSGLPKNADELKVPVYFAD